ncbi:hypothetical protein with integrase-like domain [Candidatus Nitrososphaera gargensis Ga9.2]|uniref:Core-binding (CB) domain-containing protein n=1 Tax=Nitrososphaera gargensis (strain Ga9.2) TaxID=1237085 RepID=K0IKF3_NITGG|nr:protein with integrase-like domain [Candidatus Nitrososphaera gargensis]AFU59723.1 hypothetical protein with integrase-like domain [Candidatus Nitrososphaera gargensis Ga9.2]
MPITLATLQSKIQSEVQSRINARLVKEYDAFHELNRISESRRKNNLKGIIYYSKWLASKYPSMTLYKVNNRELHILPFLNQYRKTAKQDPEEKWVTTWNDYRSRLIHFFRWLHNTKMKGKASDEVPIEDWETPDFVRIKKQKTKRKNTYSVSETWERDEILTILPYEIKMRNKAIIATLWDLDGRNHEAAKMKNKNVRYLEKCALAEVPFQTKTGGGPAVLRMAFSYLLKWKLEHPFRNDPEAPLFCNTRSDHLGEPLDPDYIWRITDNLKKRIKKLVETGAIKDEKEREKLEFLLRTKKWNPYCFRTSAIREDATYLSHFALTQKVRWVPNTRQASKYMAQTLSKDVVNTILAHDGIVVQESKPRAVISNCPRCQEVNPLEYDICSRCSYPLTERGFQQIKEEEDSMKKQLEEMQKRQQKIEAELNSMHHITRFASLVSASPDGMTIDELMMALKSSELEKVASDMKRDMDMTITKMAGGKVKVQFAYQAAKVKR